MAGAKIEVPVMLIALDTSKVSARPSKWDTQSVLMISSMLALLGIG